MKTFLLKIVKNIFLQLTAFFIIVGAVAFATIAWPTISPDGETPGGLFSAVFSKILLEPDLTKTDGKVKDSDLLDGMDSTEFLAAGESSGGGACYYTNSASCATGYAKAPGSFSSYNGGGHYICCPGEDLGGLGVPFNENGVAYEVTPSGCSGLTNEPSCIGNDSLKYTLVQAKAYCELLVFDGKNDWRLPKNSELTILFNNKQWFPGLVKSNYWSSDIGTKRRTASTNYTVYSYISLSNGKFGTINKYPATSYPTQKYYLRCIREDVEGE